MLKNVQSVFPENIDPLIFFQDANIDRRPIMETYDKLIAAGQYDAANEYIAKQKEIYGYWADYHNAIENRISSTQKYALTMDEAVITERTSYDDEPDVHNPTHRELSKFTHKELSKFIHGFMSPDEYFWIS